MCGRYSLFATQSELEERFDVTFGFEFEPRYNAAPGQSLPVITDADPKSVKHLEWGLVPSWADDASERHINARSETAADKPTFADAYENRRCLVPADGFYEWTGEERGKQPYRVALEGDRPFAMAGLWERWTPKTQQTGLADFGGGGEAADGPNRGPMEAFTVLTTEPNEVVEPLHHRMAVVLSREDERRWLRGREVSFDPAPSEPFRSYPVSTAVNDPANDDPELVRPLEGSRESPRQNASRTHDNT